MAMIKNLLMVTAIVFCMVPMAGNAVSLSLNGMGQVLLYPYYNVNQGNITFVSVTNSTDFAKAVKVRFREGVGGESVFDFTLYLSPDDVWVGAISRQAGEVKLSVPSDTSCTVPNKTSLVSTGFSAARIDADYDPDVDGTQSDDEVLERLSEGFIEVFEMARLPSVREYPLVPPYPTDVANDIALAIVHDQAATVSAPEDCTVPALFSATSDIGAILDESVVIASGVAQEFRAPSGGLFGSAAVFNAASGIYFPYNATALEQFTSNPIWWPQNGQVFSSVEGGGTVDSNGNSIENYRTADDGSSVPAAGGTLNADLPDLSTPSMVEVNGDSSSYEVVSRDGATGYYAINRGSFGGAVAAGNNAKYDKASAVTAALAVRSIHGEYITSADYNTDWVVTWPSAYTKVSDTDVDAPFLSTETASSGRSCHNVGFEYWDREESGASLNDDVGIMGPSIALNLCFNVNVLSVSNTFIEYSEVTSSKAVRTELVLGSSFADGWAHMDLSDYTQTPTILEAGDASGRVTGLPVIGFTAVADVVTGSERGGVFGFRMTVDQQ
jgi:hypothetical protein